MLKEIKQFNQFLNAAFVSALKDSGVLTPTPIQSLAIPAILEGRDVVGVSKTGSGKTLAYLLPILARLEETVKTPQAVILTPTHELAHQVYKVADALLAKAGTGMGAAVFIGGANKARQIEALRQKPRLIVGSAGRILELFKLKKLSMHTVKTIVIDEADRLLDEHNFVQTEQVVKTTLRDRQLLFFSATMGEEAIKTANQLAKDPLVIAADTARKLPEAMEHLLFVCEKRDKLEVLRKVIHGGGIDRALVFMNKPDDIEATVKRLNYHQLKAAGLFGTASKNERRHVLQNFRENRLTLLVASDLAARGLDIAGLGCVVNLDVPENPSFYLHRAGRTGRMGAGGMVVTIADAADLTRIRALEKKLGFAFSRKKMRFGEIRDTISEKK